MKTEKKNVFMNKYMRLITICFIAVTFCVLITFSYGVTKRYERFKKEKRVQNACDEKQYPEKYLINTFLHPMFRIPYTVTEEKKFVVVIPSYNNEKYCEKNLRSVFEQNYSNYRVIYIDDCSTDGTYEKVKSIIKYFGQEHRTTLIRNKKNQGVLSNLYNAIHTCDDDEIIIDLDGDDWLAHDNVFNTVNHFYANPNIWLTYGQFIYYPQYERGFCCAYEKNRLAKKGFRNYQWITSQLRTFYASLFKRIALKDLLYEGKWFRMSGDVAFFMPLLEMAHFHIAFIPHVLYVYNRETPLNDDKLNSALQYNSELEIRSRDAYSALPSLPHLKKQKENNKIIICLMANKHPLYLFSTLEMIKNQRLQDVATIIITDNINDHLSVEKYFPFVKLFSASENDLQEKIEKYLQSENAGFVLFMKDNVQLHDQLDFDLFLKKMHQTQAFSLALCQNFDEINNYWCALNDIKNGIFAWQAEGYIAKKQIDNEVSMILYPVKNALEIFHHLNNNIFTLNWIKELDPKEVGLLEKSSSLEHIAFSKEKEMHFQKMISQGDEIDLSLFIEKKE